MARFPTKQPALVQGALFVALCIFMGRFCAALAARWMEVMPVWPAAGLSLVFLLVCGIRLWPAVLLGAFLERASLGHSLLVAGGFGLANTLAGVSGVWLLRKTHFRPKLERL